MDSEVTKIVKGVRDEIVANYYKMKLNASGEFAEKTQVVEDGKSIKIVAPSYVYQMEDGRRAGTMPPVSVIRKWIRDKNANAGTDIPEEAAWAIAYVIKRDGIRVPNPHNAGGVVSSILNPALIQRITLDINKIISARVLTILTK